MIKLNRFNQATELAQRKLERLYNDEICTTEMIEPIEKAISLMWTEHDASQTELATQVAALESQSATIAELQQFRDSLQATIKWQEKKLDKLEQFIRDFVTADVIKVELMQVQAMDWVKTWDSASTEAHESQEG